MSFSKGTALKALGTHEAKAVGTRGKGGVSVTTEKVISSAMPESITRGSCGKVRGD